MHGIDSIEAPLEQNIKGLRQELSKKELSNCLLSYFELRFCLPYSRHNYLHF